MSGDGERVAFHLGYDFHRAMLEPVYEEVRREFSALLTADAEAAIAFAPRVLVLADGHYEIFRERLPETAIVWTRHGFTSKNGLHSAISRCDFACLSSEWVRDDYEKRGLRPRLGSWVTGFVPMDPLLRRPPSRRSGGPPVVLFAPTHDPSLSAAPVLGESGIDLLCRDWPELRLVIKPHPVTPQRNPEWMETWRAAARRHDQVRLIEDGHADVYALAGEADLLLTDVSAVLFYFLALDRPIVLVDNPARLCDSRRVDPAGPEWAWRDVGFRIEHADELPGAVRRCLARPEERADRRAEYRRRVFGRHADGRAAERIAGRIRALLRPGPEDRDWVGLAWSAIHAFAAYERDLRRLGTSYDVLAESLPMRVSRGLDRLPALKRGLRAALSGMFRPNPPAQESEDVP